MTLFWRFGSKFWSLNRTFHFYILSKTWGAVPSQVLKFSALKINFASIFVSRKNPLTMLNKPHTIQILEYMEDSYNNYFNIFIDSILCHCSFGSGCLASLFNMNHIVPFLIVWLLLCHFRHCSFYLVCWIFFVFIHIFLTFFLKCSFWKLSDIWQSCFSALWDEVRSPYNPGLILSHNWGKTFLVLWKWKWKLLSHVQLFVTQWTIQAMEFSRPEYWSG